LRQAIKLMANNTILVITREMKMGLLCWLIIYL
jgi:hypothetical protein